MSKGMLSGCMDFTEAGQTPATPADARAIDLLTKAVGDITAALMMAGKEDKIQKWTAPYVEAINAYDTTPPPTDRAQVDAVREALEEIAGLAMVDCTTAATAMRQIALAALAQPGPVEKGV